MTGPPGARPRVHQLLDEGNFLDGVDGVQVMFDGDAVLLELRGDTLLPVDGFPYRAVFRVLQQNTASLASDHVTAIMYLSPALWSISLPYEVRSLVYEVVVDPVLAAQGAALLRGHIPVNYEVSKGPMVVLQVLK